MAQDPVNFDPYLPPQMDAPAIPPPALRGGRPGWLTALCVIALVLGGLGLLGALISIATTVAAPFMQQALTPPPGTAIDEATRIQLEMNREQYAITARYFWPNMAFSTIHLLVATLLLVGGILALQGKATGRKLLAIAAGFAIAFELPRAALTAVVLNETMQMMSRHMEQLMQAQGGGGPPAGVTSAVMKGMIGVQLVVLGGWLLVKLVYYVMTIRYLNRSDIRAHFEADSA